MKDRKLFKNNLLAKKKLHFSEVLTNSENNPWKRKSAK